MTNKRNIYLLQGFSLYYDRRLKYYNTLEEYLDNCTSYEVTTTANFNPNDGVSTSIILNTKAPLAKWDYLLVVNYDNYDALDTPNGYEIESRWFIMDANRQRGNQYQFTLRRDVIIENYRAVIAAATYLQKAEIRSKNDPFILNSEGMSFNEIKESEQLLFDKTQCPWIVGFVSNDLQLASPINIKYSTSGYTETITDITATQFVELQSIAGYHYETGSVRLDNIITHITGDGPGSGIHRWEVRFNQLLAQSVDYLRYTNRYGSLKYLRRISSVQNPPKPFNDLTSKSIEFNHAAVEDLEYQGILEYDSSTKAMYDAYAGKLVRVNNNKIYRVTHKVSENTNRNILPYSSASSIISLLNSNVNTTQAYGDCIDNDTNAEIYFTSHWLEFGEQTIECNVDINNRTHLQDSPYDMFFMPYSDNFMFYDPDTSTYKRFDKNLALFAGIEIAKSGTGSGVYDLMLLPYCPVQDDILFTSSDIPFPYINYDTVAYNDIYISGTPNNNIGQVYWAKKSMFDVNLTNQPGISTEDMTPMEFKIENETTKYRLCSPNYSSAFDFKVTKNGGSVTQWTANCFYKPFSPYIHLKPDFKGLYGSDFNDARGLICSGDFSLPRVDNAWANYELNNKNYEKSFQRQISNLEVNQKVSREKEEVEAVLGTVNAMLSGVTTGAIIGGTTGVIVGGLAAAAGGVASGLAAQKDIQLNNQLRTEEKQYAIDNYNMSLQNIQAIPNTLSKVSALNQNNKLVPVLEKYTCTEQEKQALENKLYYDGMTINAITEIEKYLYTDKFTIIRGDIIDFVNNLKDDNHMANAIREEIQKGVIMKLWD